MSRMIKSVLEWKAAPRRLILFAAIVGLAGTLPGAAQAGGYTVYISNTCYNNGWIRTGFSHDLYTTEARCRSSIESRKSDNKRNGTDYENFAIVYQNASPPAGQLQNYVSGNVIYSDGKCKTAKICLYYAVVTYNGQTGYLGGYTSDALARSAAQQWVRGVGTKGRFSGQVLGPYCQ